MKIFINRSMLNHNDESIRESNAKDAPESKLGTFVCEALLRDLPADQGGGGSLKIKRWEMARKVSRIMKKQTNHFDCMEFPVEDVAMIKVRLAEICPTVVYGPVVEAIEDQGYDVKVVAASS